MPVMDGWEFRAIQQQDPVLGLIPVVAISADGSAQAVTMSADAYLRKPLDPSDLLQTIEGILREQEWQAMSSRLEEAEHLASLGRVAAAVGHEINNPLAFVVLNLDQSLAQLRARRRDRAAWRTRDRDARDAARRRAASAIRRTVGNLQRLSRADDEVPRRRRLAKVLDQSIAMAWNQIRHRARFVTKLDEVPPIQGNAGALGQVFLNLLVNAAQAIPEGHAEQNEIRITARADGTGERDGRDSRHRRRHRARDLQARIFEPFFTTKPAGVGTGLGPVHQPPDRHRSSAARIEIESRARQGHGVPRRSCRRPRRRRGAAAARRPRRPAAPRARGRVLVIDDEPAIGARDPRGAARRARRGRRAPRAPTRSARLGDGESFDLVLCDLVMPESAAPRSTPTLAERWPELTARMVFMTGGAFTRGDRRLHRARAAARVPETVPSRRAARAGPPPAHHAAVVT